MLFTDQDFVDGYWSDFFNDGFTNGDVTAGKNLVKRYVLDLLHAFGAIHQSVGIDNHQRFLVALYNQLNGICVGIQSSNP